jgi:hypothetical protein
VTGLVAATASAQQAFDPLNSSEIAQARQALLADTRVRASLGGPSQYAIVNVERHSEGKGRSAVRRRADVMLYNYRTRETISAVIDVAGGPRVDALRVTTSPPPPLGVEEVGTATRLALASAAVQARLQVAGVSHTDPSLIITHLFGRVQDPRDRCAVDRCVVLFFNTDAAFLFSAAVDLTDKTVRALDGMGR